MGTVLVLALLLFIALLIGGVLVLKAGLHRIPDRKVGIVYRRYGTRDPRETTRVALYGSIGPQAITLQPNTWRWLPPFLFAVKTVPQIYVPDGTIGVVEAKDGRVRPQGRRLGQYIDCDYFQDGEAFLRKGGEQGRQICYLPGGAHYSINTELFEVSTVDSLAQAPRNGLTAADLREIPIPEGYVGVVIALDGKPQSSNPDEVGRLVEGHYSFRLPWVFLGRGGQHGVQEETLAGGNRYTIHPWFARVVQIPTRDLILEWTSKEVKEPGNFDAALEQIVLDINGHRLKLEVSQVLRIPASAAPRLVRRFGEGELEVNGSGGDPVLKPAPVRRFVERVLGTAVTSYFTAIVAEKQVLEFLRGYDKIRLHLEDRVRQALDDWNVVAGSTMLGEFESDSELTALRRRLAQQEHEGIETRRREAILQAQVRNQKLIAEIDRIKTDSKGDSETVVLRKQIEVIGQRPWLMERISMHLSNMSVPHYFSGGGGDMADKILGLMPFSNAQEMLKALIKAEGDEAAAAAKPIASGDKEERKVSLEIKTEDPELDPA